MRLDVSCGLASEEVAPEIKLKSCVKILLKHRLYQSTVNENFGSSLVILGLNKLGKSTPAFLHADPRLNLSHFITSCCFPFSFFTMIFISLVYIVFVLRWHVQEFHSSFLRDILITLDFFLFFPSCKASDRTGSVSLPPTIIGHITIAAQCR